MPETCMCIAGKLVPMRQYVYLLANRIDMYIGTTMDYESCVVLEFLQCLIVDAGNHVFNDVSIALWK